MMNRYFILIISCCLIHFAGGAQASLSLADAISIGLKNNYEILSAEKDLEIAQRNNDWGIAGKYPTVDFSLTLGNNYNNSINPASFLPELTSLGTGLTPAVQASWVLFDGYRIRFTKKQLEELERLSNGNIQLAVENTIQSIITSYYAALIQQEQLNVLEQVLELSQDRINFEEVKKEFGQAGTFNILQTKDAYLNDSTSYLIQKNTLENALRSLNLAMGVDELSKRYELTDNLDFAPPPYELEALRTKMMANNKNLQLLFVNRELAQVNTRIQESAMKPSVSLQAGLSYNYNIATVSGTFQSGETLSLDAVTSQVWNGFVNVVASYRLFDSGVRKKQIENAQVEEIRAQYDIESLKRNLSTQLENTFATYGNQQQLVELTGQLVANAAQNLSISEERFKGGLINSFDYRTIQLNYINASQSRLNALFNLKNTETELMRLVGDLVRE